MFLAQICYTMNVDHSHGGVLDSLGEVVARVARRDSTWSR